MGLRNLLLLKIFKELRITINMAIIKYKGVIPVRKIEGVFSKKEVFPIFHEVLSRSPPLILKQYGIVENGERANISTLNILNDYVEKEIERGQLDPQTGFGFSVLSKGVFNVSRWSRKYPNVIVPQIYVFKDGEWKPERVEVVGAFCEAEARVYQHELFTWLKFLNSPRKKVDKRRYLENFLDPESSLIVN